jgi:hypothetical protein
MRQNRPFGCPRVNGLEQTKADRPLEIRNIPAGVPVLLCWASKADAQLSDARANQYFTPNLKEWMLDDSVWFQ